MTNCCGKPTPAETKAYLMQFDDLGYTDLDLKELRKESMAINQLRCGDIDYFKALHKTNLSNDFCFHNDLLEIPLNGSKLSNLLIIVFKGFREQIDATTEWTDAVLGVLKVFDNQTYDKWDEKSHALMKEIAKTFDIQHMQVLPLLRAWTCHVISFHYEILHEYQKEYEFFIRGIQIRLDFQLYKKKTEIAVKLLERLQMCHSQKNCEPDIFLQKQRAYLLQVSHSIIWESKIKDELSFVYWWLFVCQCHKIIEKSAEEWRANNRKGAIHPKKLKIDYTGRDYTEYDWCYKLNNLTLREDFPRIDKLLKTKEEVKKLYSEVKKAKKRMAMLPKLALTSDPMKQAEFICNEISKFFFNFL